LPSPSPAVRSVLIVGRALILFFEFGYYYFAVVSLLLLLSSDGDATFALGTFVGASIFGAALTFIRRRVVGYRLPVPGGTTEHRIRVAGNASLMAGIQLLVVGVSVLVARLGVGGAALIVGALPLVAAALVARNTSRANEAELRPNDELSSVGRRLWARAIDIAILWPLTFVIAVARDALVGSSADAAGILNGGVVAGLLIYEASAVVLFGGSIGKTLTGARVVHDAGGGLDWGRGLVRTIVFGFSFVLGPFASLLLFFPYMDAKKRALHDRLVGSVVLVTFDVAEARSRSAPWRSSGTELHE
jgi:uncharacterized RDD family membrane protein YckC